MFKNFIYLKKGTLLIEMVLVLGLSAVILSAINSVLFITKHSNILSLQSLKAQFLVQEASEAMRSLIKDDWNNLPNVGVYHLNINRNKWQLLAGEEVIDSFQRRIEINNVYRNSEGQIVQTGGQLDPSIKKISVIINWNSGRNQELREDFYLSRYRKNKVWQEDSGLDFLDGFEDATDVTSNPGYIQLAQTGGQQEWIEPTIIKNVDALASGNGIWASADYLYFALSDNHKRKVQVYDISSNPENPVSLGYFTANSEVNNLAINNQYLYAALNNENNGLQIFDLSSDPVHPSSVALVLTRNKPNGLWVQNNYLFAAVKDKKIIEVYSLNSPLNPVFQGEFSTFYPPMDISGWGNYLYISQDSNIHAIAIYDISLSITNPSFVKSVSCFYNPKGIWLESNTLYLSLSGKRAAMYTLKPNPLNPLLLGIFRTEQNSSDITAFGDYGYLGGSDSWQRAIGVIYVGDSKGFSGIYFIYGEYISSPFDAGKEVAFNRIEWLGTKTASTNIYFQIAVNNDGNTWNFVGPDGTETSYYENPGSFPLNNLLGRYLKYKIILTGNSMETAVVDKVMVNYSL